MVIYMNKVIFQIYPHFINKMKEFYLENENIPVFFDKDNVGIILSLYKKVKEDKQENSPVGQLIGNIAEFYLKYIS